MAVEGAVESQSESMRQRRRESSRSSNTREDINKNTVMVNVDESESTTSMDDEEDKDSLYNRKKSQVVPGSFTIISVTILITLTLLFVKYMDSRLPKPLMEKDIESNPIRFDLYLIINIIVIQR